MDGDSYGIVVEGDYDVGTYEELIRKICGRGVQVESRVAYGRVRLVRPGGHPWLWALPLVVAVDDPRVFRQILAGACA